MDLEQLNQNFGISGHLQFAEEHGLACAHVTLPAGSATVFLHGAHVTAWHPAGHEPVLFLSPQSDFAPGKAIRGGVPICFPWFGARSDGGPDGPSHGFARIQPWEFTFAALVPGSDADRLHLALALGPTDQSRALGYPSFRAVYEIIVGATLTLRLTVGNTGDEPMHFEEALHSYFAVSDVQSISLDGLEDAPFRDKTDGMREKRSPAGPLQLSGETDRVYFGHSAPVTIHDPGLGRRIEIRKTHSDTTVVWNPWSALAAKLPDLPDDAWPHFVCVEAANTASERITLAPGATHTMQVELSVSEGA